MVAQMVWKIVLGLNKTFAIRVKNNILKEERRTIMNNIYKVTLVLMLMSVMGFGALIQNDYSNNKTIYLNNVGVTKCWKGTCGHKSKSYTFPAYTVSKRGTDYHHGGTYLEPGATETVTISGAYTRSMNVSGGVDGEVAKASVGFTGSNTVAVSKSQSITNHNKKRAYPHLGVEYEKRTNTVTVKTRTYNPIWHITAKDKYCQFKTSKETESCKINTACGLSLLDTKHNDF